MSLVLDASVTLAWLFDNEATPEVADVFSAVARGGARVPSLWHLEVANGLLVAQRRGRITAEYRAESLKDLDALSIRVDAETNLHAWAATLELADRFQLTVYDAAYLELARRRQLPLASRDDALRRAAQELDVR